MGECLIDFLCQCRICSRFLSLKFVTVALANGGILELPWMLVDPRRPINPEMREEGVIPYMPEIPIQMDAIVNYNQSIARVSGIHTSPSGLESTCLVFVHGLGKQLHLVVQSPGGSTSQSDQGS